MNLHLTDLAVESALEKCSDGGPGNDGSPVRNGEFAACPFHVFLAPRGEGPGQQAGQLREEKPAIIEQPARPVIGLRFFENRRHLLPEHFAPGSGIEPQQSFICGSHFHASLDFSRAVATRVSCFMRSSSACRNFRPSDVSR